MNFTYYNCEFFCDKTQTLKQRLVTGVFGNVMMEQRSVNAKNAVWVYVDVLHSRVIRTQSYVKKMFRGSFAVLIHLLQCKLTQEVAPNSRSVHYSGQEALVQLCRSTSECKAATRGRLIRLVCYVLAFPGICDDVLKAERLVEQVGRVCRSSVFSSVFWRNIRLYKKNSEFVCFWCLWFDHSSCYCSKVCIGVVILTNWRHVIRVCYLAYFVSIFCFLCAYNEE